MKIRLKKAPREEFQVIEIEEGMTLKELADQYQLELPYQILAAGLNSSIVDLNRVIRKDCSIELLDMRNPSANMIYQNGLSLIFFKACKDVIGDKSVTIHNSLSKGLYATIEGQVNRYEVEDIEKRMREIVDEDIPFELHEEAADTIRGILEEGGASEKKELINKHETRVKYYTLGDCSDYFYSVMVPSTGYIQYFELRKYREGVVLRFPHPSRPDEIPAYVEEYKMYDVFAEATKNNALMGVTYISELNEKIANGEYKELIRLSEALHEKKIAEIADMITQRRKRIILIAGPSSSGKTTFARRLCIQLKVNGLNPLYMGTDDYFVERDQTPMDQYGEPDYENLGAVDVELFNQNMNDLLDGKEVDLPEFDFLKGTKVFGKRITKIEAEQPIVIEGIHALNDELTPYISMGEKFKIYISPFTQLNIDKHNRIPTTDARMLRRMARDYQYRGHSARDTIAGWHKVRAGEDKNIFPYSNCADVLFNSVHVYELAVLKKYVWPLLWEIKPEEPEYMEAARLIKFLSFFDTIEKDSVIVNNSILREFIGGSVFVED